MYAPAAQGWERIGRGRVYAGVVERRSVVIVAHTVLVAPVQKWLSLSYSGARVTRVMRACVRVTRVGFGHSLNPPRGIEWLEKGVATRESRGTRGVCVGLASGAQKKAP